MTNVTASSSASLSTSSTTGQVVIETVVLSLIILVSVLGNLSLWIVVLRSRSLRTVTNMFILGLSAADLFVATVNMPVTVYVIIKGYWNLSDTACVITGFTNMLTLVTSVLSLCNISINRYVMVVKPGRFREIYTKRKAILMISGVVVLAAFLSALPLLGWSEYKFIPTHSFCFADWANHMSYAFFMIGCCFCIPFGVMTVCNIFIFRTVRKSRQKVKIAISPSSIFEKANNSTIPTEEVDIQDQNKQEINCSSTDEDFTVQQTDQGLDKIDITSSQYTDFDHKQGEFQRDESCNGVTHNKYTVFSNNSPVLPTKKDKNTKDGHIRVAHATKPNNLSTLHLSIDTDETNKGLDDDCLSVASSTESSSLRAYNPVFDRNGRSRGRPVSRTYKQQYLTVPSDTQHRNQNKTLQKKSFSGSNSSFHSTDSEGSLRLKPIQLGFNESDTAKQTENNNVLRNKTDLSHDNLDVNTDKLIDMSEQSDSIQGKHIETNTQVSNGKERKVSMKFTDRLSIRQSNELSVKDKTLQKTASIKRTHSSPPPKRREEIVLARSLAVVVILFVLCWLPYCISMLLSIFYEGTIPRGFHMFTLIIGYANSGCNPIVYGAMNKRFAVGYKNLFCFWRDHRLSFNSSSM